MTNKELKIISDAFGSPCDYSPIDEFMQEKSNEWCYKNCDKVSDEQCWRRYIKLKLEEAQMKNYEWWLKQKQRVRKKYNLLCGKYLSPKETRDFVKRLKEKQNESRNSN